MQIAELVLGAAAQHQPVATPAPAQVSPALQILKNLLDRVKKIIAPAAGEHKNALTVSGRVSLGPKKSVVLVEVHGQSFLIAMSGDSTPAMMAIPEQNELAAEDESGKKRSSVARKGRVSC